MSLNHRVSTVGLPPLRCPSWPDTHGGALRDVEGAEAGPWPS